MYTIWGLKENQPAHQAKKDRILPLSGIKPSVLSSVRCLSKFSVLAQGWTSCRICLQTPDTPPTEPEVSPPRPPPRPDWRAEGSTAAAG